MITDLSFLHAELTARNRGPILVGLAGAGQMGTDLIIQLKLMAGMRLVAVAERHGDRADSALRLAGFNPSEFQETNHIDRAYERNIIAITADLDALVHSDHIEVIIDATGNPNIGTQLALSAIAHRKHMIMLNVEADISIGRFLKRQAMREGLVYSGAAGDEPAAALELIAFAQSLGLEIICAGKGKNNPLKFDAVPNDYIEEARLRNMNPRMLVEFIDGSKTMIEMVAIANCTGLIPDVPGMHGPNAKRENLNQILIPKEHGGILSQQGCVDYSIGENVAPGVFCIVKARHPRLTERLIDLKVGSGPFFTLMRPYHLTSLEVPLSAARAVLYQRADMAQLDRPVAEAVTIAKSNLKEGEILEKIGQTQYRAWAINAHAARKAKLLPVGLAEGARMLKSVSTGAFITYENCAPDPNLPITKIKQQLDAEDEANM